MTDIIRKREKAQTERQQWAEAEGQRLKARPLLRTANFSVPVSGAVWLATQEAAEEASRPLIYWHLRSTYSK